jgi:hypothetical protein
MTFLTACGKKLKSIEIEGDLIAPELEGMAIRINTDASGRLKAEFTSDASVLRGSKKSALDAAVECVETSMIGKGWWFLACGPKKEEIIGFERIAPSKKTHRKP